MNVMIMSFCSVLFREKELHTILAVSFVVTVIVNC